jgi:hypothetical protein
VGLKTQGTVIDPFHRIHGVDHVQKREVVEWASQDVTSVQATLCIDQAGTSERLEHLGKIPKGNLGRGRDLPGRRRTTHVATEKNNGAQSVFRSLRDHWPFQIGFVDLDIRKSVITVIVVGGAVDFQNLI